MMRRSGIVVVDRTDYLARAQESGALTRGAIPALGGRETFLRYRGFDGLAWPHPEIAPPIEDGLASVEDEAGVYAYFRKLQHPAGCDVCALVRDTAAASILGAAGWKLIGYDVGFFEAEWSHFSVILNEVLFGTSETMRRFARDLNQVMLVDSAILAQDILRARYVAREAGDDLEQGDIFEAVPIWANDGR